MYKITHSQMTYPYTLLVNQYNPVNEICFYGLPKVSKNKFSIGIWNIKYKDEIKSN